MRGLKEYSAKIIVAAHKKYQMPEDRLYLPLHVGAAGKESLGYARDDEGDSISQLNPYYCELTGLYWAWKNLAADYIGLAHYRRHFSMKGKADFDSLLTEAELAPYLGKVKIFVPTKRRYYIESLYSHYAHTMDGKHLDAARDILAAKYPEYLAACDKVYKRTWGYMFNMMIMERGLLDSYCTWLFDILGDLSKQIDPAKLTPFHARYPGRVSEILLNVWLEHQIASGQIKAEDLKELHCVYMEKINWLKKGGAFLKAKFLGVRYEKSF